jgi:hypothetical protein
MPDRLPVWKLTLNATSPRVAIVDRCTMEVKACSQSSEIAARPPVQCMGMERLMDFASRNGVSGPPFGSPTIAQPQPSRGKRYPFPTPPLAKRSSAAMFSRKGDIGCGGASLAVLIAPHDGTRADTPSVDRQDAFYVAQVLTAGFKSYLFSRRSPESIVHLHVHSFQCV